MRLNSLSEAWGNLVNDGKKRMYSIITINHNYESSNEIPFLKSEDDMVLMQSSEMIKGLESTSTTNSSRNINYSSVFPDIQRKLKEKDQERLNYIVPQHQDGFLIDFPCEKRSPPMELDEPDFLRNPSLNIPKVNLFNLTQPIPKINDVESSNNTSRSNLFVESNTSQNYYDSSSSKMSLDNTLYQKRLIKNITSKAGYKINPKDKKTTSRNQNKNNRPPWKPTSKSPVIIQMNRKITSPTSKRQQYDSDLKERIRFITKKRSGFYTPRIDTTNDYSPNSNVISFSETPILTEPSLKKLVKNIEFDPNISFDSKSDEEVRIKLSYKKLINIRQGLSVLENSVARLNYKILLESAHKVKSFDKKVQIATDKKQTPTWQQRLYIIASDNLARTMKKITQKIFLSSLINYNL